MTTEYTTSKAHTSGPWRLCISPGATEIRGEPVGDVSNPRICRVLRKDPNADANAQLIAAAPEPLVALQSILLRAVRQQASGGDLLDFQDRLRECADTARAAIAKATGTQA